MIFNVDNRNQQEEQMNFGCLKAVYYRVSSPHLQALQSGYLNTMNNRQVNMV